MVRVPSNWTRLSCPGCAGRTHTSPGRVTGVDHRAPDRGLSRVEVHGGLGLRPEELELAGQDRVGVARLLDPRPRFPTLNATGPRGRGRPAPGSSRGPPAPPPAANRPAPSSAGTQDRGRIADPAPIRGSVPEHAGRWGSAWVGSWVRSLDEVARRVPEVRQRRVQPLRGNRRAAATRKIRVVPGDPPPCHGSIVADHLVFDLYEHINATEARMYLSRQPCPVNRSRS